MIQLAHEDTCDTRGLAASESMGGFADTCVSISPPESLAVAFCAPEYFPEEQLTQ